MAYLSATAAVNICRLAVPATRATHSAASAASAASTASTASTAPAATSASTASAVTSSAARPLPSAAALSLALSCTGVDAGGADSLLINRVL